MARRGTDVQRLELDLDHGHAVDQQDHIITVVAVLGVDAQLVDDLKAVLAPLFEVHQGVLQRRAILAHEGVALAQALGVGEYAGADDLLQQARIAFCQVYAIERLELLAEVPLQRDAVADVEAIGVFEITQFVRAIRVRFFVLSLIMPGEYRNMALWP